MKLIPHHHTGQLRHHGHTSYASLAFVLLITGVLLAGFSISAGAAVPAVNPQSGSVGLAGTVRGAAPAVAARILSPSNGSRTTSTPITVSGTCVASGFVQIFKNDTFAGATDCSGDGTFSLQVDLFDGANRLVARTSDALGQFGPDSAGVDIFYDAPSFSLPTGSIGRQLFLQATTTVAAVSPGTPITRTVMVVGGIGPYAIKFDWGDGTDTLVSQSTEGPASASHAYERPGTYRVIVSITDATGNTSFLQFITIVNGPVEDLGATSSGSTGYITGTLLTAWPLYLLAVIMVGFFWLGEVRQLRKIRKRNRELALDEAAI